MMCSTGYCRYRGVSCVTGRRASGLETQLAAGSADDVQEGRLEEVLNRLGRRLETLTETERFEVVHAFVDPIVVGADGGVEIQAYIPAATASEPSHLRTAWHQMAMVGRSASAPNS